MSLKEYKSKKTGLIFSASEISRTTTYVSKGGTIVLPAWVVEDSCDFEEIKEIFFLTEDGIKITNPEQLVYYFNKINWANKGEIKIKLSEKADKLLYFSSEEVRDEYIIQNKPIFSLKEMGEYLDLHWNYGKQEILSRAQRAAKLKLNATT